jgi:tetratricopeptide (TPR) repeat protein
MAPKTPFLASCLLCLALQVPVAWAAPPSLDEAREMVRRGELDKAIEALQKLLARTKDPALREQARRELLEVLQLQFKDPDSGTIRWKYQKAIREAYEELLAQSPTQPEVLFEYGEFLYITRDLVAAEDALSRALFYGEGRAARLLGKVRFERAAILAEAANWVISPGIVPLFSSAAEAYLLAVEEEPARYDLWYELGRSQHYAGDLEGARTSLTRALVLDPNSVEALRLAGYNLRALGRTTEAIEVLLRWAARDGGFASYRELAHAYADADQPNRAIFYYDKALGLSKTRDAEQRASLLNNYAWYLCTTKNADWDERKRRYQLDLAYRMAEQAVGLTQRQSKAQLDTLAEAAFLLGRPDEAAALEAEALALDPIDPYYQGQKKRFEEATLRPLESGAPIRLGE